MPEQYPDWLDGETRVVKYSMKEMTWVEARATALANYGRIYEDVLNREDAEYLGTAYFRVPLVMRGQEL